MHPPAWGGSQTVSTYCRTVVYTAGQAEAGGLSQQAGGLTLRLGASGSWQVSGAWAAPSPQQLSTPISLPASLTILLLRGPLKLPPPISAAAGDGESLEVLFQKVGDVPWEWGDVPPRDSAEGRLAFTE